MRKPTFAAVAFAVAWCLGTIETHAGTVIQWQADLQTKARIVYEQEKLCRGWLEGFAKATAGKSTKHHVRRGGWADCRIAFAGEKENTVAWTTSPLPADWKGTSAAFVWSAILSYDPGDSPLDLYINGTQALTFKGVPDWTWQVSAPSKVNLSFRAFDEDQFFNLCGLMKLSVPRSMLKPGKALQLKIVARPAARPSRYLTVEFTDAVEHFRTKEVRNLFHASAHPNFGDVTITLVGRPEWAGKVAVVRTARGEAGRATLRPGKGVTTAQVVIPRHRRAGVKGEVSIVVDGKPVATVNVGNLPRDRLKAFLDEGLVFDDYGFNARRFPKYRWQRPGMVENEMGRFALKATFYDVDGKPVDRATKPGLYAAVVEGTTPDGFTVRRGFTLFRTPAGFRWWHEKLDLKPKPCKTLGIDPAIWSANQDKVNDFFQSHVSWKLHDDPAGASFLAGLSRLEADADRPAYLRDPEYQMRQWWVEFARKRHAPKRDCPALARPIKLDKPEAPVLHAGDPASVGYKKEYIDRIREVCREWADRGGVPFAALVARKGVIVFHEAFGTKPDGVPMTLDTPTSMASLTKLLTGCLMMQFVDQGYLGIDDPIKRFLPELDRPCETDLTTRHLFTHTGGFWGHGTWGGDEDPFVLNRVAHYLPHLEVGKRHEYNGTGYVVAGKIMERMSGRCIPYLFHERLFRPLGMTHSNTAFTPYGCMSTCTDISKVAQMLLNRGTYGKHRFFSEKTFGQMLPAKRDRLVPGLDEPWGIGTYPFPGDGLSEKTFGHGAGSGAVFRVDPVNQIIVVSCRNEGGRRYKQYLARFVQASAGPFAPEEKD